MNYSNDALRKMVHEHAKNHGLLVLGITREYDNGVWVGYKDPVDDVCFCTYFERDNGFRDDCIGYPSEADILEFLGGN